MKKLIIILTIIAAPILLAIGSNPRYIEEIAWGGGYGSTGGWLEADGDILTDGTVTATGGTVATAVTSNTGYTVNIDEDNNSTSETFAVETNASGTDVLTVTETGNTTATGTITTTSGGVVVGASALASAASITLNTAAGQTRSLFFQSGGSNRWQFSTNNTAEPGSSAGSNFALSARDDSGTLIDSPIYITRASGGAIALARPVTISGALTANGGATFGDASTDVFAYTGRLQPRTVTDSGMTATAGSAREALVYNSSNSRWYASIAGGSPATDWGYFLRNTDATQVLSNNSGITLSLKDANSTAGTSTISAEGTSGASTTYGGAITFTSGGGVAIYQDPSPTNTSNNRVRSVLYGAGSSLATFGDNTTAAAEAHVELQRSSDSVPAVLEIESADGTASYFFAGNNRTLRQHTAAPTVNTDGEFAIPDGLFGAQVGSLLDTERTTTGASYTQVTGTGSGLAVTISERTSEVIVDYQGKVAGDNGSIKVVLATTDTGTAMPDGAETAGGYFYDAGGALALSQSVQTLTTAAHSSYTKFRCHIRATRLAAGTYYVNIFYLNDVGGGSTTYIDEISVYTN